MTEIELLALAERREQRRYEIAKAVLAGLDGLKAVGSFYYSTPAAVTRAVELADALLAALEQSK